MIKSVKIDNFKSLKSLQAEFKNLNLLMGVNGMGKTSLIQSLLLLRQSHELGILKKAGLALKGKYADVGTGKDALYQFAGKDDPIRFELGMDREALKWEFDYEPDSDILSIVKSNNTNPASFSLFNDDFQYLNVEHALPQNVNETSDHEVVKKRQIGTKGEYVVHYLAHFGEEKIPRTDLKHPDARSEILMHQSDAWLREISPGTRLVAEKIKGTNQARLAYQFETTTGYTNEFKPANVGFGISYVLPVVVSLLTATPGKLVIMENPESHLHPKGQSAIGRLLALASQGDVQLLIKSHSDHVLNGIRVAAKHGEIDPTTVRIFYFSRSAEGSEQFTQVTTIKMDKNGELSEYPDGFLDEWNIQLSHLI